jgi:hypothetical protein
MVREETDLDALSNVLTSGVGETLQPAHDSLWLREPELPRRGKLRARVARVARCFVHPVGSVPAHRGHPVGVPVEDKLHGRVSERLLNVGRVSATGQQQSGVRVPEICQRIDGSLACLSSGLR